MNAIDFMKKNNNKNIKRYEPEINPKDEMEKMENQLNIEDVMYGRFEKNQKNKFVHKMKEFNKNGKPKINKHNSKILKLYLQQEADIINDMPF